MSYPFETSQHAPQTDQPLIPIDAVEVSGGRVFTTSLMVTKVFGKRHDNVLQSIDGLDCSPDFHLLNFKEMFRNVQIGNGATRQERYFEISKDGFTFLVMGYRGKKAAQFKEAYIRRFNEMETRLQGSFGTGPQGELFDVPPDPALLTRTFGTFIRLAKLGGLDLDQARRIADRETFKRLGISPLAILNVDAPANQPSYTVENVPGSAVLCATKLLKQHGGRWTAKEFHRAMEQIGYIERRLVELPDKPAIRYPVLVGEGLSYGNNVRYDAKYLVTSPVYYIDRFPTLLEVLEPVIEDQNRQEAEAMDGQTDRMSHRQRRIYKESGLSDARKAERKAEKRQQLQERKRQEVIEGAQAGRPWREIRDSFNLRKYFDTDELTELRALYSQHLKQARDRRGRFVSPQQALPASLQPVEREAANYPDWLEPKDLIDPAVRADFQARSQYQPVSREQAREFVIEEAKKFLAAGDDWETFCFMRGRLFSMAFNDAEVMSLRQAYDRAFPTGEPLDWSGAA